jgi:hypothetical protein
MVPEMLTGTRTGSARIRTCGDFNPKVGTNRTSGSGSTRWTMRLPPPISLVFWSPTTWPASLLRAGIEVRTKACRARFWFPFLTRFLCLPRRRLGFCRGSRGPLQIPRADGRQHLRSVRNGRLHAKACPAMALRSVRCRRSRPYQRQKQSSRLAARSQPAEKIRRSNLWIATGVKSNALTISLDLCANSSRRLPRTDA